MDLLLAYEDIKDREWSNFMRWKNADGQVLSGSGGGGRTSSGSTGAGSTSPGDVTGVNSTGGGGTNTTGINPNAPTSGGGIVTGINPNAPTGGGIVNVGSGGLTTLSGSVPNCPSCGSLRCAGTCVQDINGCGYCQNPIAIIPIPSPLYSYPGINPAPYPLNRDVPAGVGGGAGGGGMSADAGVMEEILDDQNGSGWKFWLILAGVAVTGYYLYSKKIITF